LAFGSKRHGNGQRNERRLGRLGLSLALAGALPGLVDTQPALAVSLVADKAAADSGGADPGAAAKAWKRNPLTA
jgi:hypothetical protein